jgi:hypothetical protein
VTIALEADASSQPRLNHFERGFFYDPNIKNAF